MVKRIRIILTALSGCIQFTFSCFQVISLWACSFTYLFDIKTGETPTSVSICFHSHTGGRTDALQLTKIAELISSNKGTDDSWKPFSDKYIVPFIHLENTIPKKTLDKIAFTPWLSIPTSGKGSSTPSLSLFLLNQSLTFWEGLTHPIAHSLPSHLLCVQIPPGVLSDVLAFLLRIANCTSIKSWHWGWAYPPHLIYLSCSWAFTFLFTFQNGTQSPGDQSEKHSARGKIDEEIGGSAPPQVSKSHCKTHRAGNGRKMFPHS